MADRPRARDVIPAAWRAAVQAREERLAQALDFLAKALQAQEAAARDALRAAAEVDRCRRLLHEKLAEPAP